MILILNSYITYLHMLHTNSKYFNSIFVRTYRKHPHDRQKVHTNTGKNLQRMFENLLDSYQGNSVIELIKLVKKISSKQMVDSLLNKIIYIDASSHKMGISSVLNRIEDRGENNRFLKFFITKSRPLTKRLLLFILVLVVGEYVIRLLVNGVENLQVNSGLPFQLLIFLIPLTACLIKANTFILENTLKAAFAFSVVTQAILTFSNPSSLWASSSRVLSRSIFCPLPVSFIFSSILGIVFELIRIVK